MFFITYTYLHSQKYFFEQQNVFSQEEYLKYFEWKQNYILYWKNPWCTLCEKLHNTSEPWQTYANITEWYYHDVDGQYLCTNGSERKYFANYNYSTLINTWTKI